MLQQLSTKALPRYDWGQEWIKPNGELSCIVIIYKDSDEPNFLDKTLSDGINVFHSTTTAITDSDEPNFLDKTLSDGINVFRNTTTAITEKSFHERYPTVIKKWIDRCQNHLMMITTHHEFAFDLIKKANFRPDMFYLYDSKRGYRRLPDTTPRELRFCQNYSRMYIAGAFDGGVGSFETDSKTFL